MGSLRVPVIELGAVIRNSFIAELESARSYGCTVRYDERKGLFFTYLTNVEIIGPDKTLEWLLGRMRQYQK